MVQWSIRLESKTTGRYNVKSAQKLSQVTYGIMSVYVVMEFPAPSIFQPRWAKFYAETSVPNLNVSDPDHACFLAKLSQFQNSLYLYT